MRYLVDTQILIWSLIAPDKLDPEIIHILQTQAILVSQISLLEIAIKQKIGKLPELSLPITVLSQQIKQDGFQLLALNVEHIAAYTDIPLLAEHRDPFDLLLLATAYAENVPIISADQNFCFYMAWVRVIENKRDKLR